MEFPSVFHSKVRWLSCAWLGLIACSSPPAHPSESEVLATIEKCFDGMAEHDALKLADVMLPEACITRIAYAGSMDVQVVSITGATFIEELAGKSVEFRERIWDAQVLMGESIATVRAPYDFHVGSEYSHCGVDHFTLVRTGQGWKIQGIAYTVEQGSAMDDKTEKQ